MVRSRPAVAALALSMAGTLIADARMAAAQPKTELDRQVLSNFSHEMTQCAAFYALSAEALRRAGNPAAADQYQKVADEMVERSMILSAKETVEARLKRSFDEQRNAIGNDVQNISVLLTRFGEICKVAFEDPEQRLTAWREELSKRKP
jgi:hypothetical protein